MSFQEDWRRRFEEFASRENDDAGIAGWSQTGLDTRIKFFLASWNDDSAARQWLDVGCGAGTYSRILNEHGKEVLALDYSFPTLLKARERTPQEESTSPVCWALGDATRLPLTENYADGLLSLGVIQALPDSEKLIEELIRVVKSGGDVWLDCLNGKCLPHLWIRAKRKYRGKGVHLRYESAGHIRKLLRGAGAGRVDIIWMPILPERLHRFQAMAIRFRFLFQIPLISHLLCHSFLVRARKA